MSTEPVRQSAPITALDRVENLLADAITDLTAFSREAPGKRCAAALAEAAAELQALAKVPGQLGSQRVRKQLSAIPSRLRNIERLLASAAEFYTGWCAVVPAAHFSAPGPAKHSYQSSGWSNDTAPALLAFRG